MRGCPILTPRQVRLTLIALAACGVVSLVGCGRPASIALAPCEGTVTLDGRPVEGWYISFHPDPEQSSRGPASMGLTGPSGAFRMLATGGRQGAVVGQHRVFLSPPGGDLPPLELSSRAAAVSVPAMYQKPETSGLVATVEPDRSNHFTFGLRSSAK